MSEESSILYVDLYLNSLTDKLGDYSGKIAITGTIRNADIASRIVKNGSELRAETIENILKRADQEKINALSEGKSVVDGIGQYLLTVTGSFEGEKAPFESDKHKLGVSMTMSKNLRESLTAVSVSTRPSSSGITINSVYDSMTGEKNGVITPLSNVVIKGQNIKVVGEGEEIGVFFTKVGGEKKAIKLLTHNNHSQLTILLADLEDGEYELSITTQYGSGNRILKEARSYTYPILLYVGSTPSGEDDKPEEL